MDLQNINNELTTKLLAKFFSDSLSIASSKKEHFSYVIYVRKSTDEEGKQVRSIEDQKKECFEYASRNKLNVVDVIEERCSAKESGKRPYFRSMLQKIEKGTYDGIIAWHPDRLSRNMKEAGEIIDLLDKDIIKDLQFVSFTFNNDPSGKLLLGITFALSKEYSDKLSVDVMRGNSHSLKEGRYPNKAKSGYYKDTLGYLRPDGANFELIKEAFRMRLDKQSTLEKIALFINDERMLRVNDSISQKPIRKMRKQEVSNMFCDPTYAGVVTYGKEVHDFSNLYDFTPVITPDEYILLNKKITSPRIAKVLKFISKKGVQADLLRGIVFCGACNTEMVSGITNKKNSAGNTSYFYYRCDNKNCVRRNKSERAKVVIDYVADYIENNFICTDEVWKHYKEEMKSQFVFMLKNTEIEIARLQGRKNSLLARQEDIKEEMLRLKGGSLYTSYKDDFEKDNKELEEIDISLTILKEKKTKKLTLFEKDEFLELMRNLPIFIRRNQPMKNLDETVRKIFLNFTILNKKVIKSTLNSPFDTLFKTEVSFGARKRT